MSFTGSAIDRIVGASALIVGIVLFVSSYRLGIGTLSLPDAGTWPCLLSVALLLLGIRLLARPDMSQQPALVAPPQWGRLAMALASIFAYALLLEPLGYPVATALLLFVQLRWVERCGWTASIVTSLVGATSTFVIFVLWMGVYLPSGILQDFGW